jgi:hypothetical protein
MKAGELAPNAVRPEIPTSSPARLAGVAGPGMKFPRRFAADPAMRKNVVIVSTASLAILPRLVETEKPVGV